MANVSSNNLTTLYSGSGVSVRPTSAYGNANVVSLLNAGTDGGNTITNIVATGNLTIDNITANGNVTADYFIGNVVGNITGNANYANFAGTAFSVAGANVSGQVAFAAVANSVAGANVSGQVSYAAVANSVNVANVVGIGNIAVLNLDGNVSNILHGNGYWGPELSNGNANYANYAGNLINGTSNVNINGSGGDISISINGVSNIATFQNNSINLNYAINTPDTIYIGSTAGNRSYTTGNLIAIGTNAAFGSTSNDSNSIAIGHQAGAQNGPGTDSVIIGYEAGRQGGGNNSVIVGARAGTVSSENNVVVIGGGSTTGYWPGANSVSVGAGAGGTLINIPNTTSIGAGAESYANSVAIGYQALAHSNNSILLNGTGASLTGTTDNSFTVKPVRNANTANLMFYNSTTGEITYDLASNFASNTANYANFAGTVVGATQSNITSLGTLTNVTTQANGNVNSGGEVIITNQNQHGGAGYAGMITMTNQTSGATNPNKYIRLNTTGDLQIINSNYSTQILQLTDSGNLSVNNVNGGNLVSANFLQGDGYLISNLTVAGGTQIVNGNTNVTALANSNVTFDISGTSNVLVVSNTGAVLSGTFDSTVANVGNLYVNNPIVHIGNNAAKVQGFGNNTIAIGNNAAGGASIVNANFVSYDSGTGLLTVDNATGIVVGMAISGTGFNATQYVYQLNDSVSVYIDPVPSGSPSGLLTFNNGQAVNTIAIGERAGNTGQEANAVAIGYYAGSTFQGISALAIGDLAGANVQYNYAMAIGSNAGSNTQGVSALAIGPSAGANNQRNFATAIGSNAGANTQGSGAVAIGNIAGQNTQGGAAVAIGNAAGQVTQGSSAVAIGFQAGQTTQSGNSVAIGRQAGVTSQGANAVAIGRQAGNTSQGLNAVAIGKLAGTTNQAANSIIINATGANLNQTVSNTFTVKPVRNANTSNVMFYDSTTGEITYDVSSNITSVGNLVNLTISNSVANTASPTTQFVSAGANVGLAGNPLTNMTFTDYGSQGGGANPMNWSFVKYRGNSATPTAAANNDQTMRLSSSVYNGNTTPRATLILSQAPLAANSSFTGSNITWTPGRFNMVTGNPLGNVTSNTATSTQNLFVIDEYGRFAVTQANSGSQSNYIGSYQTFGSNSDGSGFGSSINLVRYRGNRDGAVAIGNTDVIGGLTFLGYNGSGNASAGSITTYANTAYGAITAGQRIPVDIQITTGTNVNANTYTTTFQGDGNVSFPVSITSSGANIGNLQLNKFQETVYNIGSTSGTITPDFNNGSIQSMTLTGNITLNSLGNAIAGRSMTLIVTQDSSGNQLLTSSFLYAGGSKTLSTTPNAVDIISVFYDGSTYYASLSKGFQ